MLPLKLPTIQNWSCHNCGGCCRQHAIEVTPEERRRISDQKWAGQEGFSAGQPLFVRLGLGPWSQRYRLAHRPDGACVFLDARGLCRIHGKFGEQAKPLACRIYPYAFHPAGKRVAVSLRFSCPSVVANRGRGVAAQERELKSLERLVVPEGAERMPAPDISPGQRLDWNDTLKFVDTISKLLSAPDRSLVSRLLAALKFVELIGQSRFETVRGPRLDEFLEIVSCAVVGEVLAQPATLPEPSSTGRMQFRLLCAQYARRDTLVDVERGWRHRWRLLRAALRFARGSGLVPSLLEGFQEVPFSDLERPFGALPPEAAELLSRYLRVKVDGMHFCGSAYYNVPLVEGFQSLALVVPAVLWMARWLAAGERRTSLGVEDVSRALSIADHHHGYSPAFGQRGFRTRVRLLARLDDISKLIAWYHR